MFEHCSSLILLNLSSFDTSQVGYICRTFHECINLEYINLSKLKEILLVDYDDIFVGVPENIDIFIDENNIKEKILPQKLDINAILYHAQMMEIKTKKDN